MNYEMTLEYIDKNIKIRELNNIIESFNKYSQTKKDFNIFKILNMREDSHTELLKWLLDAKGNNAIQYHFLKNFLTYLSEMEDDFQQKYIKISDKFINNLASDISIPDNNTCNLPDTNCKFIDLLFESKKEKFVCIIENKLDAKINVDYSKDTGITQLEHYYNYLNLKYNKFNRLLLFLNTSCKKIANKEVKNVCRKRENKEIGMTIRGTDEQKNITITDKEFSILLNNFGYKDIEHSDIALILYNTLKKLNINEQPNKDKKLEILNKIYVKIEEKNRNEVIVENIINEIKNKNFNLPKTNKFNFDIRKFMENKENEKDISFILKQYIEFWESKSNDFEFSTKKKDFVGGYSKIIDCKIGKETYSIYFTDLCKIIYENKNIYNKLSKEHKEIIKKHK